MSKLISTFVSVSADPVDLGALIAKTHQSKDGAVVLFIGAVRNRNDGHDVLAVSYDAFGPLAERTLHEIARELEAQVKDPLGLSVVHRTGRLSVGETSVAIVTASPHREDAFSASRYVIEEIKRRLPVWKQEHYVDGDSAWLQGCCLRAHDGAHHL